MQWPYDYATFTNLQSMTVATVWEPRIDDSGVIASACDGKVQETHYSANGGNWLYGPAFLRTRHSISGANYVVLDMKGKNPMVFAQGLKGFVGGKGHRPMVPFSHWWVSREPLGRRDIHDNVTSTIAAGPTSTGTVMALEEDSGDEGWVWPDEIVFDGDHYVHVGDPQSLIYQDDEGNEVDFALLMPLEGQK